MPRRQYRTTVAITLKPEIVDGPGDVVRDALIGRGFPVTNVRVGKELTIIHGKRNIENDKGETLADVLQRPERLRVNPPAVNPNIETTQTETEKFN